MSKKGKKKPTKTYRDVQWLREYQSLGDIPSKKIISKLQRRGDIDEVQAKQLIELMAFDLDEKIAPIIDQFQPIVRQVLEKLADVDTSDTKYSIRRLRNQDARIFCTTCDDETAYVDVNGGAINVEKKREEEVIKEYERLMENENDDYKSILEDYCVGVGWYRSWIDDYNGGDMSLPDLEKLLSNINKEMEKPTRIDDEHGEDFKLENEVKYVNQWIDALKLSELPRPDTGVHVIVCPVCEEEIKFIKQRIPNAEKFNKIAFWAVRSILKEVLSNQMITGNKGYQIIKEDGPIPIKLTNADDADKRITKGERNELEEILNLAISNGLPLVIDGEESIVEFVQSSSSGSFRALTIKIKDELARKLSKHVSDDIRDEFGEDFDSWCQRISMHIIFAIITHTDMIESFNPKTASNNINDDGGSGMTEANSTLTEAIHKHLSKEDLDLIRLEIAEDSLQPMIVEPKPWRRIGENEFDGGFILEQMRKQRRLIPSNQIMKKTGHPGFEPSDKCVEAINSLQRTAWAINKDMLPVIEAMLDKEVCRHIEESLLINWDSEKGKCLISLNSTKDKNDISLDSVREWKTDLHHAKQNVDYPLYHVYYMDYRGRIYSTVSRLDHQGDDISRAMLLFHERYKINARGWYWFKIHTVAAWQGRAPNESWSPNKQMTYAEMEKWAEKDEFIEAMKMIAKNPIEHVRLWGEGDILRSKAEGFQRLAITKEFAGLIEQTNGKGVGGKSALPIHQDASSNIYQHMAMGLRDKDMAKEVNVIPDSNTRLKADVYAKIAIEAGILFEELIEEYHPNISPNTKQILREYVEDRGTAKNPVMIRGYGAGTEAIMESFLTHNQGSRRKDGGRFGYIAVEGENGEQLRDDNGKPLWQRCAHHNSHLARVLAPTYEGLNSEEIKKNKRLEYTISAAISEAYSRTIELVLPSYKKTRDTLNSVYKKATTRKQTIPLNEEETKEYEQHLKTINNAKDKQKIAEQNLLGKLDAAIRDGVTIDKIINSTKNAYQSKVVLLRLIGKAAGIKGLSKMKKHQLVNVLKDFDNKQDDGIASESILVEISDAITQWTDIAQKRKDVEELRYLWILKIFHEYKVVKPRPQVIEKDGEWKIKATVRNPTGYLRWNLPDGSVVTSVKLARANSETITIPEYIKDGENTKTKMQEHITSNSKITENHDKLSEVKILTGSGEINWEEIRVALGTHNQTNNPLLSWEYDELQNDNSIINGKGIAWLLKKLHTIEKPSTSTIRITNSERADDEGIATTPNFVHSYDACHLREVIIEITQQQDDVNKPPQFWCVHDSFGVASNDVDAMRVSIINHFVDLYKDVEWRGDVDVKGPLDVLSHRYLGEPLETIDTLNIEDVAILDKDGHPLSEWFVGP